MTLDITELANNKQYGGWNRQYQHQSKECGCKMTFTVYFPPQAESGKVPVVYYLSGLTCTDKNFIEKAGAQRIAAKLGLALIAPDTSPRGLCVEGEDDSWDFGTGAGFYVDATMPKWQQYRMYSYVVKELPELLASCFQNLDTSKASIMGHSMGGHGALTIGLRNPDAYASISAFAPICHPSQCPWGNKAFNGYLGDEVSTWKTYDATELLKVFNGNKKKVLIDQGEEDGFYKDKQLLPEDFQNEAGDKVELELRMQPGYDHSYYFISTFMEDHLNMHAQALGLT